LVLITKIFLTPTQDNKMHKCLTTLEGKIVLKGQHEGVVRRQFVAHITIKKVLDVGYQWPILFKDIYELCKSCDNC
jgi:hypothetical protein